MEEYEAAWHDTSDPAFAGTFPASILDFQRSSNWYLAVNGRHPSPKTIAHNTTTCWLTPGALNKGSYFGLNLLSPKRVQNIKIVASSNLGNVVGKGQEDLTAESWEVWTKDVPADLEADADLAPSTWSRRAIRGKVKSMRIGESTLYEHSFTLSPNAAAYQPVKNGNPDFEEEGGRGTSGEDEEEEEGVDQVLRKRAFNDGDGEAEAEAGGAGTSRQEIEVEQTERDLSTTSKTPQAKAPRALQPMDLDDIQKGTRIEGIRFISRDRKSQPVRICGFDLDGWAI